MSGNKEYLQLATYMCPSVPVDYYETLSICLEQQLGIRTSLIYDSRNTGPKQLRGDSERIDIGFISTSSYLQNYRSPESSYALLPIGAVSNHSVKGSVLGYYTDIVLHKDLKGRVKEFSDLRGCPMAYAGESSISSAKQLLANLKQNGENASFFSTTKNAGSHVAAIEDVIAKKVEVASVSSISLNSFLNHHYYLEDEVYVKESWGPLPPEPMIFNKSLPGELVNRIKDCFLNMHKLSDFGNVVKKFGIQHFEPITDETYYGAMGILDGTKTLSLGVAYY